MAQLSSFILKFLIRHYKFYVGLAALLHKISCIQQWHISHSATNSRFIFVLLLLRLWGSGISNDTREINYISLWLRNTFRRRSHQKSGETFSLEHIKGRNMWTWMLMLRWILWIFMLEICSGISCIKRGSNARIFSRNFLLISIKFVSQWLTDRPVTCSVGPELLSCLLFIYLKSYII